jgi:hypothetical protein
MNTPEDFGITKYDKKKFKETGVLDCYQDVELFSLSLKKIPFTFGVVNGVFNCSSNQLTTLEGCPTQVDGNFHCFNNKLTSLEGCPAQVSGDFNCSYNQLTSLIGCTKEIGKSFNCFNNKLISLDGCPTKIGGDFYGSNNDFDVNSWIEILEKHPYTYTDCNIVPKNSSYNEVLQSLKDKLEIINMIKAS